MLRYSGLALCLLWGSSAFANTVSTGEPNAGVLDLPMPASDTELTISTQQPAAIRNASSPEEANQALRTEFVKEKNELEKLPRAQLQQRAENGERAAQVTLAEDFAKEAALLSFSPEAANDALSDAVRWYAMAASTGFPGAPSLDQAGVKFYPIRVQRSR